jgi:hypothetical protein
MVVMKPLFQERVPSQGSMATSKSRMPTANKNRIHLASSLYHFSTLDHRRSLPQHPESVDNGTAMKERYHFQKPMLYCSSSIGTRPPTTFLITTRTSIITESPAATPVVTADFEGLQRPPLLRGLLLENLPVGEFDERRCRLPPLPQR